MRFRRLRKEPIDELLGGRYTAYAYHVKQLFGKTIKVESDLFCVGPTTAPFTAPKQQAPLKSRRRRKVSKFRKIPHKALEQLLGLNLIYPPSLVFLVSVAQKTLP